MNAVRKDSIFLSDKVEELLRKILITLTVLMKEFFTVTVLERKMYLIYVA